MRRIALLVLALAATVALPATASAAGGGGTVYLKKNIAKAGVVGDGGQIDCGLTCTEADGFYPGDCESQCIYQDVTLSSQTQPGWKLTWANCPNVDEETGACTVIAQGAKTITASFSDIGAPSVTIGGPTAGTQVRGTIGLTATAADNDSVSRVEFYAGDTKLGEDGSSPYAIDVDTSALADGTRTFSVKSFDPSGNASDAATRSLLVDNTKPTVSITGGTAEGALVGAPGNVSFQFEGADATAGVTGLQCALDGGDLVSCDSMTTHAFSGVAEGTQKFLVRAVDTAGNVGDFAQRTFTVDKTKPALAITGGPAEGALVGKPGAAEFGFQTSDAHGTSVTCALDAAAFGPCSAGSSHTVTGLADGPHSVKVRSVDGAGNESVVTRSFKVDTTAPAVAITSGPEQGSVTAVENFSFAWSIEDASPGLGALECKEDGGAFGSCDSIFGHDWSGLADGAHTFTLRVVDSAGNETVVQRAFTVDTVAPDTTIDTASPGASSAFTFSSSEPSSSFKCRLYKAGATPPAFGDCVGASGSHSTSGLAPGDYVFEVVAADAAGNTDATAATKAFTVTAPSTEKPGTDTGTGNPGTGTGDPGTGTGNPGTGTGTPGGAERIDADATWEWNNLRGRTRANSLIVKDIPAGATVEVICKGKGCPFAKKAFPYKKATLELARKLKKKRMKAGTTLEVRVVKPGAIGWVVTFKMRKKGQAAFKVQCLPVGATKAAAC